MFRTLLFWRTDYTKNIHTRVIYKVAQCVTFFVVGGMFWDLRLSASVAEDSDLRRLVVKLQTFRWSIVASSSGSRSPRTFDTSCRPVRQESLDRLDCHALLFCSRQNIPTDCQVVSWQCVGMLWRGMLCMPYVCPQRKTVFAVACIKWHK